jgi:UrcA family protein
MSRFAPHASSRPRALAALAALGAITAALLAQTSVASAAQPSSGAPRVSVYYSFNDLATEEGTRALYHRIARAAQSVCPSYDALDLQAWSASRECQRQAVSRAVKQIGNARLAAVYARAHARRG